jgi:hypothetical protein
MGQTGLQGNIGATGLLGATGPFGETGAQGIQGPQGVTGLVGQTGIQGFQGSTGVVGETGLQGSQGDTGVIGLGTTGPQGVTGITGTPNPSNMTFTLASSSITTSISELGFVPFSNTLDTGYTTATCIVWVDIPISNTLDLDVYDTTATSVIGTLSTPGSFVGLITFTFTIPTADTVLVLRAQVTSGTTSTVKGGRARFT